MKQQIRFCRSFDGAGLAFAVSGQGPAIVRAPHWLSHLEYEWESPIWKPWIETFSKSYTLVRTDERACGLSDLEAPISFEAWVCDLEAVADAAGLQRFALFGHSQGGAIAIEYAVRHPERVTHLVILGGYARGSMKRGLSPERVDELNAQLKLVEQGWGREDPSYRQMFAMQFVPGGTLEQINSFSELERRTTTPVNAMRIMETFFQIDVISSASKVQCPALVLHVRDDRRVPFEEGRILARLIPGARLVPLDSANHVLLEHEPAYRKFFDELRAFLPRAGNAPAEFPALTPRERDILDRIAQGLDNAQIAAHLDLSEKTVRNNITHIFAKLGVENRAQAIVLARDAGFGSKG
ncbi:MAG TPA: alpha/beta fold hydrolase [Burkholderiales bacterium]|nr:alpha/beta fold hydrolase [Burkholderiales bacterium]HTQ72898.1 alpha/beta fold hydrolase [Burkholderiales bacterium]